MRPRRKRLLFHFFSIGNGSEALTSGTALLPLSETKDVPALLQFLGWTDYKTEDGIGFRIVLDNTSLMPLA